MNIIEDTKPTLLRPGFLEAVGAEPNEIPIDYIKRWIKLRMPELGNKSASLADRVLIVCAKTGSGKSTTLPVNLFRLLKGDTSYANIKYKGPSIICTQPRILTAISLSHDISDEKYDKSGRRSKINPDIIFDENVGFLTGPISSLSVHGIIYSTIGVLAMQLQNVSNDDEIMNMYKIIIVDEAHERSSSTDMTLMMLKNFYLRNLGNPRLPFLILASATIDTKKYADYFHVGSRNIVVVSGSSYSISDMWPEKPFTGNYLEECAKLAIKIHEEHHDDTPDKSDIMIFIPGTVENKKLSELLTDNLQKYIDDKFAKYSPYFVTSINREVVIDQSNDYNYILESVYKLPKVNDVSCTRKIIIATVVAETGITIPSLKYVIDCGWNKTAENYLPLCIGGLITKPEQASKVIQRRGRVGRKFDGIYYPMFTKSMFEKMDKYQYPDIINIGIDDIFLNIVSEQQRQKFKTGLKPEFKVEDINMLDPPPIDAIQRSNYLAYNLGYTRFDINSGFGLTKLGALSMSCNRLKMDQFRILLAGFMHKTSINDLITIVTLMKDEFHIRDMYVKNEEHVPKDYYAVLKFAPKCIISDSDSEETIYYKFKSLIADEFIEFVLLIEYISSAIRHNGNIFTICTEIHVNFIKLISVLKSREEIIEALLSIDIQPFRYDENRLSKSTIHTLLPNIRNTKKCLYDGLKHNLLRFDKKTGDYVSKSGMMVKVYSMYNKLFIESVASMSNTYIKFKQPKWVLSDKIFIDSSKKSNELLYVCTTNMLCYLDGYINVDYEIDEPRRIMIDNAVGDIKNTSPNPLIQLSSYDRICKYSTILKYGKYNSPAAQLNKNFYNDDLVKHFVSKLHSDVV